MRQVGKRGGKKKGILFIQGRKKKIRRKIEEYNFNAKHHRKENEMGRAKDKRGRGNEKKNGSYRRGEQDGRKITYKGKEKQNEKYERTIFTDEKRGKNL